jgi:hypothetical protein
MFRLVSWGVPLIINSDKQITNFIYSSKWFTNGIRL